MDINSLRVFNVLHKLGITEEEFRCLEDEQRHTERTGLYIQCIKRGYAVCIGHDDRHTILIQKMKKDCPAPSRVLFKTLITFDNLPDEIYTLHAISQYRRSDSETRYRADNLEELKDRICDRFVDKYPKELGALYEDIHYQELHSYDEDKRSAWKESKTELVDLQLKALFWVFGEDYSKFEREVRVARKNIPRIIKVFERNNRRLALIHKVEDYERQRGGCGMGYGGTWTENVQGSRLMIRCFKPNDVQYDYVDVNREMYLPEERQDSKELWLDDDLFEKTGYEELKVLSKRITGESNWILLNADEFNNKQTLIRIEVMSATRKAQEKEAEQNLIQNINKQFSKGRVVRQGITFTEKSIECEGIIVENDRMGEYILSNQVHLQREPDFQRIVENFIAYILNIEAIQSYASWKMSYVCNFKGAETVKIGEVRLHIESRKNNVFINDHRIPKDDLIEVIFKALNYTDQGKFDEYLAYSSRVNIALQKALRAGGISFELKLDKTSDNELPWKEGKMILSLPLKRMKGKNYTTIGRDDHRIKDLNALLDLGKDINECRIGFTGYLQRTIKLLYRSVDGITPKIIGELIANGQKEYEKLQARVKLDNAEKSRKADEFVKRAVLISKAKKIKDGFLVKGLSGKAYTVNQDTLAVYDKDRYVCIVDMGTDRNTDWGKKDALAKRLLMLSQDLKVANDVHTLNLSSIGDEVGDEL